MAEEVNKVDVFYNEDVKIQEDLLPDLGQFSSLFEGVTLPPRASEERKKLERKLKLKLDLTIFPLLICMYILNYLDRNNLAASKLGTIMEDLNLTATQFSTCQAILFVGYISMQLPANMIMEKLGKPQYFLPGIMIVWGTLSACIAAVNSYSALVGIRAILGVFEAGFYPGVMFYLSSWYTREEIGKRIAIFYTGSLLSGAFGGLIAYGVIEHLNGVHGLASWRWLFLIEGVLTVGVSLIALVCLPELPATTRWLSKEERLLGVVRLIEDIGQVDDDYGNSTTKQSVFAGMKLAFKDVKVFLFLGAIFSEAAAASINSVFPTIVKSLGYSSTETLLLTAPPWLLVSITSVLISWHSDKTQERFWHLLVSPIITLVAFVIGISTVKTAPRYVAMMLLLQMYNSYGLTYAWTTSSLPRPPIKRAAAIAMINIGGNIPNVFAPYMFTTPMSPHFFAGFGYCIACCLLAIGFLVIIRLYLAKLNKRINNGEVIDGMEPETGFRFRL